MIKQKDSYLSRLVTGNLTEDDLYNSYFDKKIWSLDIFASLAIGLSPDLYKQIVKSNGVNYSSKDNNKVAIAFSIKNKFLKDIKNKKITDIQFINEDIVMSPWKFIKWMALNKIPLRVKFLKSLPIHLMELLLEFQPMNVALRNKSIFSREYHIAYYLKNDEELIKINGNPMTPTEIYKHPYMKDIIQRHIRELGGHYKKRTIIESWLPRIHQKRTKGRPKKTKN